MALLDEERTVSGGDPVVPDLLDAIEATGHLVKGDIGSAERIGSEVLSRTGVSAEAAVHAATASTVALGFSGRTVAAMAVARQWERAGAQMKTSNLPLSVGLTAAYWELLELDGDVATLNCEAERARRSAIEQGDDMTATRAAKALARSSLLGGRPRHSSRLMRECLVALDGFDRMFISWCQCLLAEALALAGEGTEARRTLDQSDEQGPIAPVFAFYRTLAGAAVAASEGHVAKAAEIAANGALEAIGQGMMGVGISVLVRRNAVWPSGRSGRVGPSRLSRRPTGQ